MANQHDRENNNISNSTSESYAPSWHALLKDVHAMDKEVTILKLTQSALAADLAELKDNVKTSNRVLSEVRDTIMGWKGSLVIITSVGGTVAAVVFYFLQKLVGPSS